MDWLQEKERIIQMRVPSLLDYSAPLVVLSFLQRRSFCKLLQSLGSREQDFPLQMYLARRNRDTTVQVIKVKELKQKLIKNKRIKKD